MASAERIAVEVVYALPDRQTVLAVQVPPGASVGEVVRHSGMLARHPEIELAAMKVGIYGRRVTLDTRVRSGDRIELYRPLVADPKTARHARAAARVR